MELAVAQGFDVKVVSLPPGIDPADDPAGFEARLADARGRTSSTARSSRSTRADDRQRRRARGRRSSSTRVPDSPERQDAWRWANDRLGMTVQLRARPAARASAAAAVSPQVLEAGDRLERDALAGVVAHPELMPLLAELTPEHFDDEPHRALREHLVDGEPLDADGVALLAELDARGRARGDRRDVGTELLLALGERALQEDLQTADFARTRQIQEQILQLREAQADVRKRASLPD